MILPLTSRPSSQAATIAPGDGRPSALRRPVVCASAGIGLVLLLILYTLMRTPGWYAPPVIAPEERQAVRNNLIDAEQAFTESVLNLDTPFIYHLYQHDVNRWIAMRREIYPLIDELAPPVLQEPFVVFEKDRITLAGRYQAAGVSMVLSCDIEARYDHDAIVLKARSVRCGSIRMPIGFGRLGLSHAIERPAGKTWPGSPRISGDFVNGLRIDAQAWWKNGGVDYRVVSFEVKPGQIDFGIQPLGRHASRQHSDQPDP